MKPDGTYKAPGRIMASVKDPPCNWCHTFIYCKTHDTACKGFIRYIGNGYNKRRITRKPGQSEREFSEILAEHEKMWKPTKRDYKIAFPKRDKPPQPGKDKDKEPEAMSDEAQELERWTRDVFMGG